MDRGGVDRGGLDRGDMDYGVMWTMVWCGPWSGVEHDVA